MSANHVIWRAVAGTTYCALGGLSGVPKQFEIKRGISRANGFPKDASFAMNKRFPKQVALADSLSNMEDMVVVSAALKELVEGRAPQAVELLPVAIINHKGRNAGAPYWIVSPLVIVDGIDQGASKLFWNAINPRMVSGCTRLVLDAAAVPADLLLFRLKFLENLVLVRRDLADAITAGGFTGVRFVEIAQYPG